MDPLYLLLLGGLIVAVFWDLKIREIPDWLNYFLIASGLGIRVIISIVNYDYIPLVEGLIGFGVFSVLGIGMYYSGQWGGGDAKLLMGCGAILGLWFTPFHIGVSFLLNGMLIGGLYGVLWFFIMILNNRKTFVKAINKEDKKAMKVFLILILIVVVLLMLFDFPMKVPFIALILLSGILIIMMFSVKTLETSCLIKKLKVSLLREGDWIVKDVFVKKKKICGPQKIGITNEQIALLKKHKINQVFIKEGMPFAPPFLISFLISLIFGNILLLLI